MEKIVVVGAGFSGSIIARKIAEMGYKVTIIERRDHIGGNAYDEYDENGILIQRYGPHFINTNNYKVIEFLEQYGELIPYDVRLLSYIDGNYVRLPFNFRTLQQLVGAKNSESLLAKMRQEFAGRDRVPIFELINSQDGDIRGYGELLFEKAYRTYTAKQWGIPPESIDKSVIERVPMAMNFDERYLNKDFQYLPLKGFTNIFSNILDHDNIEVRLKTDAFKNLALDNVNHCVFYEEEPVTCLVFTGAIDELFNIKYGRLPYRSLRMEYDYFPQKKVLPCEIISYPQASGYTRKTEYKQFTFGIDEIDTTVVVTEFPLEYDPYSKDANIPYYPVLTDESNMIYKKYMEEVKKYKSIFLCGRLAEFKYYNMDVCIEHSLQYFETIKEYLLNVQ